MGAEIRLEWMPSGRKGIVEYRPCIHKAERLLAEDHDWVGLKMGQATVPRRRYGPLRKLVSSGQEGSCRCTGWCGPVGFLLISQT